MYGLRNDHFHNAVVWYQDILGTWLYKEYRNILKMMAGIKGNNFIIIPQLIDIILSQQKKFRCTGSVDSTEAISITHVLNDIKIL